MIELLIHQWKEKIRSPYWQKSIWLNIVLGIIAIYLMMNIVFIGFFADLILQKIFPDTDVVQSFTRILFYYFAFDLIFRFFAQQIPALSVQPYLTLPIPKSKLLHYPLIKSFSSFVNVLALLLILPFFGKIICTTFPPMFCICWIITILSLIATNNFLNFSLKKYFSKRPIFILFILVIVGLMIYLDIIKFVSFSGYFSADLLSISKVPILIVIPVMIAVLSYYIGYNLLKKNAYIEDIQTNQHENTTSLSFLSRYGEIGNLMRTEIKMILRNKRPKSLLYLSIMFLAYGFIFYQDKYINNYMILILLGFFLTSILAIQYGQFSFSWESSFFDSYLANKITPYNYLKSKYLLFALTNLFCFVATLPYALISYKIGFINTAMLLYNIGISSVVLLYICTWNTSRIDLGRSQFMNYQGTGVTHFLSMIPIAGFPIIVYLLFKHFGVPEYSIYTLGLIGLIAIVFNKYLLQMLTMQFIKRRYKMALGFRQI
jgi:hypothetical protein